MKLRLALAAITLAFVGVSADAQSTHVRGYYRSNGTYVAPHYRSSPNSTRSDNWTTRGNVNPYTGAVGTRNPYGSSSYGSSYGSSSLGSSAYGADTDGEESPQ